MQLHLLQQSDNQPVCNSAKQGNAHVHWPCHQHIDLYRSFESCKVWHSAESSHTCRVLTLGGLHGMPKLVPLMAMHTCTFKCIKQAGVFAGDSRLQSSLILDW